MIKIDRCNFHAFVASFVNALEARDQYTAGHSDRVADLAERMAMDMGFDRMTCEGIHISGHLHDIGKIGIPDGILLKTGELRPSEYDVIKEHAYIGWKIMKDIPGFMPIAEIILQHHERIDGSGYPYGLKGSDICPGARILGVADTFDALTTFRSYKKPVDCDRAIEIIRQDTGIKFSSEAVDSFINVVAEYSKTREKTNECFSSSHI